jgi:hypothetical protein
MKLSNKTLSTLYQYIGWQTPAKVRAIAQEEGRDFEELESAFQELFDQIKEEIEYKKEAEGSQL